jgi:hypothetical protein
MFGIQVFCHSFLRAPDWLLPSPTLSLSTQVSEWWDHPSYRMQKW